MKRAWNYVVAVGIGMDVTLNALTGGRKYQTISCRVGESIKRGGWASLIPWPEALRRHFLDAVFKTVV